MVFLEFYDRVVELCKNRGISPAALARDIGLSNSATTYWKRGSIPKSDTLEKIADYFGVSVDYLLGKAFTQDGVSFSDGTGFGGGSGSGSGFSNGTGYGGPIPDRRGKTETFQPWTKMDQMVFDLGGFEALAEFEFLSDEDRAEAIKDINTFVKFTLSKYRRQDAHTPSAEATTAQNAPEGAEKPE